MSQLTTKVPDTLRKKDVMHVTVSLKDFTTTMTETQGGTGGDMHNFDDWDVPLIFKDGRLPRRS